MLLPGLRLDEIFILFPASLSCQAGPQVSEGKRRMGEDWLGGWHGQSGPHSQGKNQEALMLAMFTGLQLKSRREQLPITKTWGLSQRVTRGLAFFSAQPSRGRTQASMHAWLPATDVESLAASGLPFAPPCSRPLCIPLPDGS